MSIDITELKDAAAKAFGEDGLRPARDESWSTLVEMGWLLMPVPEDAGGLGLGRDASVALALELGRVLSPLALPGALAAVRAIAMAENFTGQEDFIGQIAEGQLITAPLVFTGAQLSQSGGGYVLNGTLRAVQDANMASHLVTISEGRSLCALIPLDGAGVTVSEAKMWDETRRFFDVTLSNHIVDPALILAKGEAAVAPMALAMKTDLIIALAADSIGAAHGALHMSVEYLKTRKQFDRPLAMFQALKHRCANLATEIAAGEALLNFIAQQADITAEQLAILKPHATELFCDVSEDAIQLHGGIGLTQEHDCHWFFKRAMMNRTLAGGNDSWLENAGRAAMGQQGDGK